MADLPIAPSYDFLTSFIQLLGRNIQAYLIVEPASLFLAVFAFGGEVEIGSAIFRGVYLRVVIYPDYSCYAQRHRLSPSV
jgi:hypothetical protein